MELNVTNKSFLADVTSIYTENQFTKMMKNNSGIKAKEVVAVLPVISRGERCAEICTADKAVNKIVIVSEVLDHNYICFLLNTLPCQVELFKGKFNSIKEVKINKKRLGLLKIPVIDLKIQELLGLAEKVYSILSEKANSDINNSDIKYLRYVVANFCNCLAFDLFTYPLLKSKGINLIEHWAEVIDKSENTKESEVIINALIKNDSAIRNDILKTQLFIDN